MGAEWLELPELRNLATNLVVARLERGFSQGRLARECRLSQAQVSLFEAGRRLPSLDQFVRIARALDVPLQRLFSGADRPGENLKDLAVELRRLGAVDLWVAEAAVPGSARRPEEVITLVLSGGSPDPRVVETLPALLSWNEINPTILRAYGIATKTLYRLAWLADIALAIDRLRGFPGGCRRDALERFLKAVNPPETAAWDALSGSSGEQPMSPIWRRWRISYGATITDFEKRATELAAARQDNNGAAQSISRALRVLLRSSKYTPKSTSAPKAKQPRSNASDALQAKRSEAAVKEAKVALEAHKRLHEAKARGKQSGESAKASNKPGKQKGDKNEK
jgi:transcriptional regulator with XRE-family HTH domain